MSQLTSNKEKTLAELRAKMSQLEQSTTDISDFVEASDTSFLKPNMSQKRESDNFTLQNTDISNANTDDTVTAKKETYKQLRHKITRLLSKREHSLHVYYLSASIVSLRFPKNYHNKSFQHQIFIPF